MALRSHLIVSVWPDQTRPSIYLSICSRASLRLYGESAYSALLPRLFRAIDQDLKRRPTVDLLNLALCQDFPDPRVRVVTTPLSAGLQLFVVTLGYLSASHPSSSLHARRSTSPSRMLGCRLYLKTAIGKCIELTGSWLGSMADDIPHWRWYLMEFDLLAGTAVLQGRSRVPQWSRWSVFRTL